MGIWKVLSRSSNSPLEKLASLSAFPTPNGRKVLAESPEQITLSLEVILGHWSLGCNWVHMLVSDMAQ